MNIKLSIYVLWFLLINITFVLGQNEDLHFSYEFLNYTIEDGLPSNETYSIIQDDEGYLWISTDNGVSKYNGYEFENFTTEDGLIDNTIFKMFKDDKGRIWMPGYNGKLCYYENGKFIAYKYNNVLDSLQKKLLTSALITDLYIHKDFVFVKYDFGYNCIDNKGKVVDLKTKKFYLLEGVNQIIINEDNYFLNKLIYLNLSSKNDFLNLKLSEDNKEKTKNYPCSYNFQKQTFYAYSTFLFIDNDFIDLKSHIYSMRSMNTHTLLVCTNNKIIEIDIKEKKITRTFLNENSISSAFQDLNGGWWFASTNKGLFYLINTDILKLYSNNNIVDDIFPISYKEKNNLYFYDYHQKQNYKLTNKSISKCENVINVDKLDVNSYNYDLSFSPFDAKFNNESFSNAHFNGVLSFCYRDSNLVYANRNAVLFYDLSIEKLDNFFIKDFMTMQYLANKRVFIGTKTQAFVLDLSTMKILNKPINTSNSVKALMIMPNLDTIIGFNGSGLNILSIDSNYFLNSENSELLSNSINNFLLVNDKLWIATSSGLNSISYNDEKDLIIQNELNQYQGLLTSRIRQIVIINCAF